MIEVKPLSPPVWARWLMVALWMALIFLMSAQPSSGEQSGWLTTTLFQLLGVAPSEEQRAIAHTLLRKGAHFVEYAVLAVLIAWAQPGLTVDRAAITWAGATLYAASDEWHQSFVPNRGPAIGDVLIDSLGAFVGVLLWVLWRRR